MDNLKISSIADSELKVDWQYIINNFPGSEPIIYPSCYMFKLGAATKKKKKNPADRWRIIYPNNPKLCKAGFGVYRRAHLRVFPVVTGNYSDINRLVSLMSYSVFVSYFL